MFCAFIAVPLSAVRTDKPAPYVQAIENGRVVNKAVTLGQRGSTGAEPVVGIEGLADNALVIRGNIGALREGTSVSFTAMEGPAAGTGGTTPAGASGNDSGSAALQPKPAS